MQTRMSNQKGDLDNQDMKRHAIHQPTFIRGFSG